MCHTTVQSFVCSVCGNEYRRDYREKIKCRAVVASGRPWGGCHRIDGDWRLPVNRNFMCEACEVMEMLRQLQEDAEHLY